LSITDHDTFEGYEVAVPIARDAGLRLIRGIELSTRYNGTRISSAGWVRCRKRAAKGTGV
jgi:predicted metal-dependent phosphoesterase TrpH